MAISKNLDKDLLKKIKSLAKKKGDRDFNNRKIQKN